MPGRTVRSGRRREKLAIVHWIFGGGFGESAVPGAGIMVVLGMKEFYGGGLYVRESNNTLIFVRSSYRVCQKSGFELMTARCIWLACRTRV